MITNEDINSIIETCSDKGYEIRIRDISFILLCKEIENKVLVYRSLFSADSSVDENAVEDYANSPKMEFLTGILKVYTSNGVKKKVKKEGDITFEENKAYMLKLKRDTEKAMADGEIETKDGLKILADISIKLNDKFKVNEEKIEQMVIVNTKYNAVCSGCGREIYIPTDEELIKKYNLVKKNE